MFKKLAVRLVSNIVWMVKTFRADRFGGEKDPLKRSLPNWYVEWNAKRLAKRLQSTLIQELRTHRRRLPPHRTGLRLSFAVAASSQLPYYNTLFKVFWGVVDGDSTEQQPLLIAPFLMGGGICRWRVMLAAADRGQCAKYLTRDCTFETLVETVSFVAKHMLVETEICLRMPGVERVTEVDDKQDVSTPPVECQNQSHAGK